MFSSSSSSSSYRDIEEDPAKEMSSSSSRGGDEVKPKLAREVISIDDSSDDDGDSDNDDGSHSSLEILPPARKQRHQPQQQPTGSLMDSLSSSGTASSLSSPSATAPTTMRAAAATTTKLVTKSSPKTQENNVIQMKRNDKKRDIDILALDSDDDSDDDDSDDEFLGLLPEFSAMKKMPSPQPSTTSTFATTSSGADSTAITSINCKSSVGRLVLQQQTKEDERQRKKREREEQTKREKQTRAQRRQDERDAREREKIGERIVKKRQNQRHSQVTGKYKHSEIAVLMEKSIYKDDPYGLVQALSGDFFVHRIDNDDFSFSSTLASSSIQFIRKDFLAGGAEAAVKSLTTITARGGMKTWKETTPDFELIQTLVLTILPNDFIPLLRREDRDEDDDFPALQAWLGKTISRWQKMWSCSSTPRLFLILLDVSETLDEKWVEHRRHQNGRKRNHSLPTAYELQDAMQVLLIKYQVECLECSTKKLESFQSTIHILTRALCDKPYANNTSELECVKKIKVAGITNDDPLQRASDVWLGQLQQIRGLAESQAQNVVAKYPTCQSLWQAYRELDDDEVGKASLLANVLSAGSRKQRKLSQAVYRIMTSNDPDEMVC